MYVTLDGLVNLEIKKFDLLNRRQRALDSINHLTMDDPNLDLVEYIKNETERLQKIVDETTQELAVVCSEHTAMSYQLGQTFK